MFNNEATIGEAVASAQSQSLSDIEILVIDDGSSDRSLEMVTQLAREDARIRLIALPKNQGVSHARNRGISEAKGVWLAVLDADDAWLPARLEKLIKEAEAAQAEAICDNLRLLDAESLALRETTAFHDRGKTMRLDAARLFSLDLPFARHTIGLLKPVMRKDYLARLELRYDERYSYGEDFLLLSEMVLGGGLVLIAPEAWYNYRLASSLIVRKRSAHSRTEMKYAQIVEGRAALFRQKAARLDPETRKSFERHVTLLQGWGYYMQAKSLAGARKFGQALSVAILHPSVFLFVLNAFWRKAGHIRAQAQAVET
jgi:succinoglycan biosynthesis protein ExoO